MLITCHACGRPVADVEPPEFNGPQVSIVRRFLAGAGLELGPELDAMLNPTPETITASFKVRHPACV